MAKKVFEKQLQEIAQDLLNMSFAVKNKDDDVTAKNDTIRKAMYLSYQLGYQKAMVQLIRKFKKDRGIK